MLNEGHGMHDFINGCESSADAAVNVNVRKAAGLHQLHELALLKELQSELRTLSSAMATASKKKPGCAGGQSKLMASQLALVSAHAQAELERLKSLPPTSHVRRQYHHWPFLDMAVPPQVFPGLLLVLQ